MAGPQHALILKSRSQGYEVCCRCVCTCRYDCLGFSLPVCMSFCIGLKFSGTFISCWSASKCYSHILGQIIKISSRPLNSSDLGKNPEEWRHYQFNGPSSNHNWLVATGSMIHIKNKKKQRKQTLKIIRKQETFERSTLPLTTDR